MVRPANVGRSRACLECKKKRIKCDLQSPACQRCLDSHKTCSGPVSGLLILNTSTTRSPFHRKTTSCVKHVKLPPSQPLLSPSDSQSILYETPSPASIYDELLLLKFLDYFSQNAAVGTWSPELPRLNARKNATALRSAARAVSLAFMARRTGNHAIAIEACKYYGQSLQHHRDSFAVTSHKGSISQVEAENALPVTVLLCYFEMIQATNAHAWLEHTFAAERLFLRLGRKMLETDSLLNHLYFIVRSNSAIRCLLPRGRNKNREAGVGRRQRAILFEREWRDVRMRQICGKGTMMFLELEDRMLWLSSRLTAMDADTMGANGNYDQNAGADHLTRQGQTLYGLLDDLVRLWAEFADAVGFDTETTPLLISRDISTTMQDNKYTTSLSHQTEKLSSVLASNLPLWCYERSASLTYAFFNTAVVLVYTLLNSLNRDVASTHAYSQGVPQTTHLSQFQLQTEYIDPSDAIPYHCDQILAAALYLEQSFTGCACLRMIGPLSTVHRYSPDLNQQSLAEFVFRRWAQNDGLAGLGAGAFGGSSTFSSSL